MCLVTVCCECKWRAVRSYICFHLYFRFSYIGKYRDFSLKVPLKSFVITPIYLHCDFATKTPNTPFIAILLWYHSGVKTKEQVVIQKVTGNNKKNRVTLARKGVLYCVEVLQSLSVMIILCLCNCLICSDM